MFSVTSLIVGSNLCYHITIILFHIIPFNNLCYKGKVYIYAFHLRKGGVI